MDNVRTTTGDPTVKNFDLAAAAARNASGAPAASEEPDRSKSAAQRAEDEKKRKEAEAQLAKNKALNEAFNAGKDAVTAKNYDAAIDAFHKATELDANQHVVWANLGEAYVDLSGTKAGADKQAALDKGAEAYGKALAIKPDDANYHNNYALVLAKSNKFSEAQAELTKAAQLDPTQAGKYYYNLGAVLVNNNQTDQAIEAFKKTIEIDPNYADAHYQLGVSLMAKATTADGKMTAPPGTAEELQKYLQLQPNGPNAEAAKGMLGLLGTTVETQFSKQPQKKK
jgi:tetratricopeptide (TPR) repeat protein